MIRKLFRYIGLSLAGLISLILIYGLLAFCLSRITVNEDVVSSKDVTIYIRTNGVHTDLVLPIRNSQKDWSENVKIENTTGKDSAANFVAFGWGDKGFYLDTPTWADLKVSTAFSAAFALGESAMHTTFYKRMNEDENCKAINVSHEAYGKLVEYVESSFEISENGMFKHIVTDANYGSNDSFYEAVGSYSLLKTCNTWTNTALKSSGQKASLWTPLDTGIFYHYNN